MVSHEELERLVTNLQALADQRPETTLQVSPVYRGGGYSISEGELRKGTWICDSLEIARRLLGESTPRRRRRESDDDRLVRLREELIEQLDAYVDDVRTSS